RVGLLGLLAQYHGVVGATDRAQRVLEAERRALCEGKLRRGEQDDRNKARRSDTNWHGSTSASRPAMMPQRLIPLIVPAAADLSSASCAIRQRIGEKSAGR